MAPFWDDIDTRFGSGIISFEVQDSGYFLEEVSEFIRRRKSAVSFTGTWMLIVYWEAVHPWFGFFNNVVSLPSAIENITDFVLFASQYTCVFFVGEYIPSNHNHRWDILLFPLHIQM